MPETSSLVDRRALSAALVLIVVLLLAVSASAQAISASSLIYKSSGLSTPLDGRHTLYTNGYVGTFVQVTTPGPVTFTVRANGVSAGGVRPLMHLHVADCKAAWAVSGAPSDYSVTFDLPSGLFALRIEFSNALVQNGQVQTLFVYSLTVSGGHATLANADSDANALASADSYITNYRRAPATVTILDANGNPLPAGVSVRVKLRKHGFNFGTCVPGSYGDLWWAEANPAPGSTTDRYQKFIDSHFSMITPEACGKWAYQEGTRDSVVMSYVDQYLDYADKHGLRARMHPVFWDNEMSEPAWVNDLENRAKAGDVTAKNDLRAEMTERIQYYVTPRAGRYLELDGINETVANPVHTTIFGIPGIAGIYNEIVAASAGRAKVYVNELNVLRDGNYGEWYRTHIQSILDAGGTIQGIGCQTNLDSRYPTAARTFHRNLQNIDGFEFPVSTTEYRCTMGGDTVKQMNLAMRLIFGNDMTTTFLMWGFWRNAIYSPNNEILVNADWTLSACGVEYERLMALWSTDMTTTTDAGGRVSFTGYYGDYDVTINGETYPLKLVKGTDDYVVYQSPFVVDHFDRLDGSALGKTEDPTAKTWVKGASETAASISTGRLTLATTTQTAGVGVGDGYLPADLDLRVSMEISGTGSAWAGVAYRESQPGASKDGYTLRFFKQGTVLQLRKPSGTAISAGLTPSIDWSVPQCVHFRVSGGRHEVWIGSRKVLDYTDSSKLTGGYVSLIRSYGSAQFDNFVVSDSALPVVAVAAGPSDIRSKNDLAFVELPNVIVTRRFSGFFYAQDAGRNSGIRVVSSRVVNPGDVVSISGIVGTENGEKLIYAWSVDRTASGAAVPPLAMTNSALGGRQQGLQGPIWGFEDSQQSRARRWTTVDGPGNAGLLVRLYGHVTQIDPAGGYFYVDDGSGTDDGTTTARDPNRGVRVQLNGSAYAGKYVAITGISSCFVGPDSKLRRLLMVAGPEDVQVVQ